VLPRRRALLVEEVDQTKWIKEIVGNGGYRNAPRSFEYFEQAGLGNK
jgi:hypothetical protein